MISPFGAAFSELSIHQVGNKLSEEQLSLSEYPLVIVDEILNDLLLQYFINPFEKTTEYYNFYHPTDDLELNEVFHFTKMIFQSPATFHEQSKQLAKHLYAVSSHPNIKVGELYLVYFNYLQVDGELYDAIGIFKSESKEPFLTIERQGPQFEIGYQENAINIKKLDKGCLILNTNSDQGYQVAVIDQTNRSEAAYWMDNFLQLKVRNDDYTKTNETLRLYKNFVTEKLDTEFDISKTDKIDLLNKSIQYFKTKDEFTFDEFANEVIGDEKGIEIFKSYKEDYEKSSATKFEDNFSISNAAVKKQARHFKSVLKLDKNFHIYIHGDKEMIEQGFDEERNMNFYKVYYRNEQ